MPGADLTSRSPKSGGVTVSTQAINRAKSRPEPKNGDSPGKKKFGLVLQGAAALGAYEVGAIEYLYESGMECAIVSGASSGAMNAAALAGAKGYPPQVLRELWGMLAVNPPIPLLPPVIRQSWSMFGVPHMYTPRLDWWNMPSWTYLSDNTPFRKTLEDLLDWDQIRDPGHMRLTVSASGVEDGGTTYFSNLDPAVPLGPEHVMASGSFPGGFPWTRIKDRDYWDGGLTDNTPLKPVIDNAQSYTRFISVLKQVDDQLPADAPVRKEPGWDEVMNYAHVRQIRMIDMKKPAGESGSDWSPEAISRRLSAGYDQTRSALEEVPLMV